MSVSCYSLILPKESRGTGGYTLAHVQLLSESCKLQAGVCDLAGSAGLHCTATGCQTHKATCWTTQS
jgi:hypothetical protein